MMSLGCCLMWLLKGLIAMCKKMRPTIDDGVSGVIDVCRSFSLNFELDTPRMCSRWIWFHSISYSSSLLNLAYYIAKGRKKEWSNIVGHGSNRVVGRWKANIINLLILLMKHMARVADMDEAKHALPYGFLLKVLFDKFNMTFPDFTYWSLGDIAIQ